MRFLIICSFWAFSALASPPWIHYVPLARRSSGAFPLPTYQYQANESFTDFASGTALVNNGVGRAILANGGYAFSFNGSADAYQAAPQTPFSTTSGFTISCWFQTTSTSGGSICSDQTSQTGDSGLRDYPVFMQNNGTLGFAYYSDGPQLAVSSSSYNDGNWHCAAATLTESTGSILYIDGVAVASKAQPGGVSNFNSYGHEYWRIGNGNFAGVWGYVSSSAWFNGFIRDFRVYYTALTPAQVRTIYAWGPQMPAPFIPVPLPPLTNQYLGNLADSGSAANLLINDGSSTGFATGTNGQAFSFNGSADAYQSNSEGVGSAVSLSCWFKTASTNGGSICSYQFAQTGDSGLRSYPIFMQNNGTVGFGYYSGGAQLAISSSAYNDGQWHCIVVSLTHAAGSLVYIDGQCVASNPAMGGEVGFLGWWRLGNGNFAGSWGYSSTSAYWNGLVQDFRVYPLGLTTDQAETIFLNGPNN